MSAHKHSNIKTVDGDVDAISEAVANVDTAIAALETKYGFGRLLLATPDLDLVRRVKAQSERYNRAIIDGLPEDITQHGQSLIAGYQALEKKYLAAGFLPLDPTQQQEALLPDGTVLVVVPTADQYIGDGRQAIAIGVDQVADLLADKTKEALSVVAKSFPGCRIESIRDKRPLNDGEVPF